MWKYVACDSGVRRRGVTEKAPSETPIEHFVNVSEELVKQKNKLIIATPYIFSIESARGKKGSRDIETIFLLLRFSFSAGGKYILRQFTMIFQERLFLCAF